MVSDSAKISIAKMRGFLRAPQIRQAQKEALYDGSGDILRIMAVGNRRLARDRRRAQMGNNLTRNKFILNEAESDYRRYKNADSIGFNWQKENSWNTRSGVPGIRKKRTFPFAVIQRFGNSYPVNGVRSS